MALAVLAPAAPLSLTSEITGFDMHPDFWAGLLPSYIAYKFNLDVLQLIPGRGTEVSLTLSTGITPRTITQDPLTGAPLWIWREDAASETRSLMEAPYDTASGGWSVRFGQGFGSSARSGADLVDVWASFDGDWERALDPVLQLERKGHPFKNPIFDYEVADGNGAITPARALLGAPDLAGDRQMLSMSLNLGFDVNDLRAETSSLDGIDVKGKLTWAPERLGGVFSGKADYWRFWLFAQGGWTAARSLAASGLGKWSLVLDDQMELRILGGPKVPKVAEKVVEPVWGLAPDNMTVFLRNSLKLRYYGRQFLGGLCVPSAYAFLDLGFSGGKVNNYPESGTESFWTGSMGVNLELRLFEVLRLYYTLGYIFSPGKDAGKEGFHIPKTIKLVVQLQL